MTPDQADFERDQLRERVLDALDKWARARFGHTEYVKRYSGAGGQDRDLPNLFKALDAHFETCLDRFGVTVQPETREQAIKALGLSEGAGR